VKHFTTLQSAYNWAEGDCFQGEQRQIMNPEDDQAWIQNKKWSSYQYVVDQLDTTERAVPFYNGQTDRYYILFHDPEPEWDTPTRVKIVG